MLAAMAICPRLIHMSCMQPFSSSAEHKYRKLLSGIELTKNFYFSFTYPVWRTLQTNMTRPQTGSPYDSMYVWNDYLTRWVA